MKCPLGPQSGCRYEKDGICTKHTPKLRPIECDDWEEVEKQ